MKDIKSGNGQSKLRISEYLKHSFSYSAKQKEIEVVVRERVKWVFDLARNTMIVGAILFLGRAVESSLLTTLGYIGCGLIFTYIMTYLEPLNFRPFHFIKNKKIGLWMDFITNILIFVPFGLALNFGVISVVEIIADAYLTR